MAKESGSSLYITTAIPYVNAKPHIGTAVEMVYADVLARFWRLQKRDVWFLCGTDEHGQKIQLKAEELGKNPQAFVDEMAQSYRDLLTQLNISNDDFIRTTETRHVRGARVFWERMQANGFFEKRTFEGLYCVGCEEYKTEKDLVDKRCPAHNMVPELLKEENYFFLLSKPELSNYVQEILEKGILSVIPEHRKKEMIEFVKQGLQDIPASRPAEKLAWGIPIPGDDAHVMYVWIEALMNYVTALGFGTKKDAERRWSEYEVIHIIGKDINRFHTVIWPAILKAAAFDLPMKIAVHGHISVNGKKMSKSLGNVVMPTDLVTRYGVDATRYLLMAEIPFAGDGDFSWERFDALYTSALVNGLGNVFFRITHMIEKFCEGKISPIDHGELPKRTLSGLQDCSIDMESFRFRSVLGAFNVRVSDLDDYIDKRKPWELATTDDEQLRRVLEQSLFALKEVVAALVPFMPIMTKKMLEILNAKKIIKPLQPLFPRL